LRQKVNPKLARLKLARAGFAHRTPQWVLLVVVGWVLRQVRVQG